MKSIGIIGFGNMGSAIAGRIKSKYRVIAFDEDEEKTKNISGIGTVNSITDLLKQSDAIVLAVKPQDFDAVLSEVKPFAKGKLIISIAAGIKTQYIEKKLGGARVVRAMPNLPVKVGKGISCLCKGKFARGTDLKFSEEIFKKLGKTLVLKENMMDAATAISGSGPGFLCGLIENMPYKQYSN